MIDTRTWRLLDLAGDAEKGLLPVAGGVLDQAASFAAARRVVTAEQSHYKTGLEDLK